MSDRRRPLRVTDEQFRRLFDLYPDDPEFIREACQEALYEIHVPNQTGRTQSGLRVYYDDGWNGSGYLMLHWDDAKRVGWARDNGYMEDRLPESELPIIWDEDPGRERLLGIRRTLREWAY